MRRPPQSYARVRLRYHGNERLLRPTSSTNGNDLGPQHSRRSIVVIISMLLLPTITSFNIAQRRRLSISSSPSLSLPVSLSLTWQAQDPRKEVSLNDQSTSDRRTILQTGIKTTLPIIVLVNAFTASVLSKLNMEAACAMEIEIDTSALRPATPEQPQIQFPDIDVLKELESPTTLEGLIYLKNPKSERRPTSNDVIVISIRTTLEPDTVVAGAMIPVSRIPLSGFPFQFRINAKNAIRNTPTSSSPQDSWDYLMKNNDLLVQAVVCSRDKVGLDDSNVKNRNIYDLLNKCQTAVAGNLPPLSGQGIAKLIKYRNGAGPLDSEALTPQLSTTIQKVIIRAPVSLPLG